MCVFVAQGSVTAGCTCVSLRAKLQLIHLPLTPPQLPRPQKAQAPGASLLQCLVSSHRTEKPWHNCCSRWLWPFVPSICYNRTFFLKHSSDYVVILINSGVTTLLTGYNWNFCVNQKTLISFCCLSSTASFWKSFSFLLAMKTYNWTNRDRLIRSLDIYSLIQKL